MIFSAIARKIASIVRAELLAPSYEHLRGSQGLVDARTPQIASKERLVREDRTEVAAFFEGDETRTNNPVGIYDPNRFYYLPPL